MQDTPASHAKKPAPAATSPDPVPELIKKLLCPVCRKGGLQLVPEPRELTCASCGERYSECQHDGSGHGGPAGSRVYRRLIGLGPDTTIVSVLVPSTPPHQSSAPQPAAIQGVTLNR